MLDALIKRAKSMGASDLHLEPGLPAVLRIRGTLESEELPILADALLSIGRTLVGDNNWSSFIERGSFDLSINLNDTIQTGASDRMWSLQRYREWLENRTDWFT